MGFSFLVVFDVCLWLCSLVNIFDEYIVDLGYLLFLNGDLMFWV